MDDGSSSHRSTLVSATPSWAREIPDLVFAPIELLTMPLTLRPWMPVAAASCSTLQLSRCLAWFSVSRTTGWTALSASCCGLRWVWHRRLRCGMRRPVPW